MRHRRSRDRHGRPLRGRPDLGREWESCRRHQRFRTYHADEPRPHSWLCPRNKKSGTSHLRTAWTCALTARGEEMARAAFFRSEEHTSELQSHHDLVCRLLLEKKKKKRTPLTYHT